MKHIAFIIPYFGKFNNYFNLWLESCRNNPTVDWFILTDNSDEYNYPDNVHKISTTLTEIRKRFEDALDLKVALDKPYKICDLRPSFLYVFENMVRNFAFVGWCDVDLIWGNMRQFLTDEVLDKYDMISRWGHCTLLKNTEKMRRLFMTELSLTLPYRCPDYKEAFSSTKSYVFDETPFLMYAMHEGLRILSIEDIHYDISINYKYYHPAWHSRDYFHSLGHDVFYYEDGNLLLLTSDGCKFIEKSLFYAHFQKRRMENRVSEPQNYCISNDKFINIPKPKTAGEIIDLSPRPLIDFTPQKRFLQRIKRKLLPSNGVQFYHWPPEVTKLKDRIWNERYCS